MLPDKLAINLAVLLEIFAVLENGESRRHAPVLERKVQRILSLLVPSIHIAPLEPVVHSLEVPRCRCEKKRGTIH